jgi:glycosyltransferase involved in cell wall biosynthesis
MKQRYSAIHVNNMPDFLVFSTIIPRLFGAKVILDIHDPMPNTFVSKFRLRNDGGFFYRLLLWQERLSAVYSSKVVTVHHPVRDGILLEHGIPAKSIEVIANFADERLFPLRKSFHVNGQVRLVFHGTILERSGLRTLVNGLAKVRNRDRVFLKIIGEGDFSETLKQLILSLGIGDKVEFDNQSYPVHSIAERFAECNVGVVPLEISSVTNYALPLKLLEYISLGLPVVSVRNEAISYYFKEEDCIFFDWNDPSSLSAALDRIAECPKMLMRYHQRAIELREQFGWAGEKAKYINLLRELTGAATK